MGGRYRDRRCPTTGWLTDRSRRKVGQTGASRRHPDAGPAHCRRSAPLASGGRTPGARPGRVPAGRAGDADRRKRASGSALRAGRTSRSARRARGGLLEHRQLRALQPGRPADRRNPRREPARAGLRPLGAPGPGRWVTIYSTTSPTDTRLHRDRGTAAGHQPQRYRHRARTRRGRSALAPPRPHPDLGALVDPPSAGTVMWRSWAIARSTTC